MLFEIDNLIKSAYKFWFVPVIYYKISFIFYHFLSRLDHPIRMTLYI